MTPPLRPAIITLLTTFRPDASPPNEDPDTMQNEVTTPEQSVTWFVVRTNPRCESRAARSLEAEDFRVYLPTMAYEFRHKRSKAWIERWRPLFTGYLFLGMPTVRHWGTVRQCDGVAAVLGVDGLPLPVSGEAVDRLRQDQEAGRFDIRRRANIKRTFTAGERAMIAAGPMAGLEVVVEAHKNRREVRVMADLFGSMSDVIIGVDNLKSAA